MVKHILVGFDGSDSSRRALRFAHDLAQQTGAKLTVLFVLELPLLLPIGPMDSYLMTSPATDAKELERVHKMLDEAVADLPKKDVEKRVEVGRAAQTLCDWGEKLAVDLIVVGARGLGAGGRWLLGSISDRVVHHAGRPVVVVH